MATHPEIIKQLPTEFKSASIVPYDEDGYWLGLEKSKGGAKGEAKWVDFGGKRERRENAWETATRELLEETGLDLRDAALSRPPIYMPLSKQVIFTVKTRDVPRPEQGIVEVRAFPSWPPPVELHPRIRFDKGLVLRDEMRAIGF